jgi:transposase-like protein
VLSVSRHRPERELVDVLFSEHRDMAAAQAFFRSAKAVTGVTPDRVTTDGHDSYPRAIRTELGRRVAHRTSAYKNNRLEQDHRGIKRPPGSGESWNAGPEWTFSEAFLGKMDGRLWRQLQPREPALSRC